MELTTLSDWVSVYVFYLSQIIIVITSIVWFYKEKRLSVMIFSLGFFLFLYGNYSVVKVSRLKVELEQRNEAVDGLDASWRRSRSISSSGLFLASIALAFYVVRINKKEQQRGTNNKNTGHA